MSGNNSAQEGSQEKGLSENVQTVPQNLTTIQNIQTVQSMQSMQNAVSSGVQTIQTSQAVTGQATTIVGKSISLELNSKLLMKPPIPSSIGTSSENSKITTSTFCPVGSVRIITPGTLSTIERQTQLQVQQTAQQGQQIGTSVQSTYHVPRGPAAVANISAPRATLTTPLVRAISTGQIPISRAGIRPHSAEPHGSSAASDAPRSRVANSSGVSTTLYPLDFSKRVTITKTRSSAQGDVPCRPNVIVKAVKTTIGTNNMQSPSIIISRGNTTGSTTQWQPKTTSVIYAQPQRHPVPVANRPPTRPAATTVYTSQQQTQSQPQSQQQQQQQSQQQSQPRLVSPSQIGVGRPVQATVVTATPPRLIAPVLQAQNNSMTRLPTPTRPPTSQVVTSMAQVSQAGRSVAQAIQPNQTSRPMSSTPINRIAVSAPVIGTPNRVATVTSVQTNVGRQLTINTAAGAPTGTVSRIVIPQQTIQQQQQQQQPQGGQRVLPTVTPLTNFSQVSRVIATTSGNAAVAANVTRVAQTGPTSVARITGMSLHPLPLTPARATPTPLKVTAQASGIQTVQLKQTAPTIQSQPQVQQQSQQQQQVPTGLQRTISGISSANTTAGSTVGNQQSVQVQGQYLHQPHTTTYYSIEPSGTYSQYRQTSVQPVRLVVEQGFEEPLAKPNASPRPSILRKREHDSGSPVKGGVAKNLVPVLASLPAASSVSSPPGSPKGDRDGGGHNSSGSTTVSATSSPGLDEEPEQRIPMNPTMEMSPRKKPRKQQLAGVELTESRCNDEEMQFITEEKIKKDIKEDPRDKYGDRKHVNSNSQQESKPSETPKSRPGLLKGTDWKNRWGGSRLHHYRRPTDVRPREERRPTVTELSQQKDVLQKCEGWKVHHLSTQMGDLADVEKSINEKLKITLSLLEQQTKSKKDDNAERVMELIKGNMQRSTLISEGMVEARTQLNGLFQHKPHVTNLLQSCGNKRSQKRKDNNK